MGPKSACRRRATSKANLAPMEGSTLLVPSKGRTVATWYLDKSILVLKAGLSARACVDEAAGLDVAHPALTRQRARRQVIQTDLISGFIKGVYRFPFGLARITKFMGSLNKPQAASLRYS